MNIRTDKRKRENYIPVGINAGGITSQLRLDMNIKVNAYTMTYLPNHITK